LRCWRTTSFDGLTWRRASYACNPENVALVAAHKADLSAGNVQGIITREDIMDALAGDMEVFAV